MSGNTLRPILEDVLQGVLHDLFGSDLSPFIFNIFTTESTTPASCSPTITVSGGVASWNFGDGSAVQLSNSPSRTYTDLAASHEVGILDFDFDLLDVLTWNSVDDDILTIDLTSMPNITNADVSTNANMTSILAGSLSLTVFAFTGSGSLLVLDLSDNALTAIDLTSGPVLTTVDLSDNSLDAADLDQSFVDIVASSVNGGTYDYSGNGAPTDLPNYTTLVVTRLWTLTGPVPTGQIVTILYENPVANDSLQGVPNGFAKNDQYSYDFQNNSVSFLQAYYPFAGGSTLALEDKSTNLRNLAVIGTPVFSATGGPKTTIPSYWQCVRASAEGFTATGYKGVPVTDGIGAFTVSLWFYLDSLGNQQNLVSWGTSLNSDDFRVFVNSLNEIVVNFDGTAVVYQVALVTTGVWYHIAVRYRGGNATSTKLFVDNVDTTATVTSIPSPTIGSTVDMRIGENLGGLNNLDGRIADVRISDEYVSDGQIALWYRGETDRWVDNDVPKASTRDLIAHWTMDDTAATTAVVDSINANDGVLAVGTASTLTDDGKVGTALVFNGSTEYADVPFDASLNTDTFSFSLWARVDGGAGAFRSPISSRDASAGYILYAAASDDWRFWLGNGTGFDEAVGPAVVIGETIHIACTYDGTNMRFYANGVIFHTLAAGTYTQNVAAGLRIGGGANEGPLQYPFGGMVDNIRYHDRVLSAVEVRAMYSNECPEIKISMDDDAASTVITDSSKRSDTTNMAIAGGSTADLMSTIGSVKRAMIFDGLIDYLYAADDGRFSYVNELTVSIWVKRDWSVSDCGLMGKEGSWRLNRRAGTNNVRINLPGLTTASLFSLTSLVANTWTHVVATYNSATIALYIDGALDNSVAATGTITTNANPLRIGNNAGKLYKGELDDGMCWSVAMTADQVAELYNKTSVCVFGFDAVSETSETCSVEAAVGETGVGSTYLRNSNNIRLINSSGDFITS